VPKASVIALVLALTALVSAPAAAQTAASFNDLTLRLRVDDTVRLRDTSGRIVRGRITAVSSDQIVIDVNGQPTTFPAGRVGEVAVRHHALGAAALIGLASGATVGILFVHEFAGIAGRPTAGTYGVGGLVFGADGAGLGVGIGAIVPTTSLVYRAPGGGQVSLAPFVTRDGLGVRAAATW
jgi:hypothetical protein